MEYFDGMNRYMYCMATPLNAIDPTGLLSFEPPWYETEIFGPMEVIESQAGPVGYGYMCITGDNGLIQDISADLDHLACLAKCIADDPEKLAKAAAAAGWNLGKDTFEDVAGIPGAILAMIQFERAGDTLWESISLDKEEATANALGLFDAAACKSSKAARELAEKWGDVDRDFMRALELWAKNGGHNMDDFNRIAASWKKNPNGLRAAKAHRFARAARDLSAASRAAAGGARLAGKVNGLVTTAQLLHEVAKQIQAECEEECCSNK